MPRPPLVSPVPAPAWHALPADAAAEQLDLDPLTGLTEAEAARRLAEHGPNRLIDAPREPRWRAFLRRFQDLMIVILLIAAVVSLLVSGEWETPVAIVVVVLLNATIGFVQESRAEASLDALRTMSTTTATVRRGGGTARVDAVELVPGDVVVLDAGDRVPADGRLWSATSFEVQEAALTGEAAPTAKSATAQVDDDAPLADRVTAVYMNTVVTRGRAEMLVTATGMSTETGRIAGLLSRAVPEPTPLQRQVDDLARTLAAIAVVVIAIVLLVGLVRGQAFSDLFVTAVSLAVAAIPEGLPAVVAFTLAMGTGRLAKAGAIVKKLASVETLGSTSQICTDKTGTLTLNQMTARELVLGGRRFTVSGEGYGPDGRIRSVDGTPVPDTVGQALRGMALCTDSEVRGGEVIGDPTEGALLVLAQKGGVDVAALRRDHPRLAEVPFDSHDKFMATFHRWHDETGRDVVRCFVKGAPDVLAARADRCLGDQGVVPFDHRARETYDATNAALGRQGMRVLAVGVEDLALEEFDPGRDLKDVLDRIVLLALVGIVDPPRPEVEQAIAQCRAGGIRVRMVTGDHAVTAGAIAGQIGIPGRAVTGRELDGVPDEELASRLDEVGVVARVSPEHKLRIVGGLQTRGDVVAMTGDGVNDAPALRKADIGVAMGVTGTEVSKEAATMVLTDDNFATIVRAVREGRGIYDNIVKFTRFQVSTALGFVVTFLVASATGIAGGAPFGALQILFVNLVMDGPPAMSLGVDPAAPDVMRRPPRPRRERILTRERFLQILLASVVMAAGTLAVLVWGPGPDPRLGEPSVAGTMAFATFVFFQVFNLLNVRSPTRSVFTAATFENRSALLATAAVVVLLVAVVEIGVLQGVFTTTGLTLEQWLVCAAIGSTILWVVEILKIVLRRWSPSH